MPTPTPSSSCLSARAHRRARAARARRAVLRLNDVSLRVSGPCGHRVNVRCGRWRGGVVSKIREVRLCWTRKRLAKELKDWRADPSTRRCGAKTASARDYVHAGLLCRHTPRSTQTILFSCWWSSPAPARHAVRRAESSFGKRLAQDYPFRWGKDHLVTPIYHCNFNEMGAPPRQHLVDHWPPRAHVLLGIFAKRLLDRLPTRIPRRSTEACDRRAVQERPRGARRAGAAGRGATRPIRTRGRARARVPRTRRHGWRSSLTKRSPWESEQARVAALRGAADGCRPESVAWCVAASRGNAPPSLGARRARRCSSWRPAAQRLSATTARPAELDAVDDVGARAEDGRRARRPTSV